MSKRKKPDLSSISYRNFAENPRFGREPRWTSWTPPKNMKPFGYFESRCIPGTAVPVGPVYARDWLPVYYLDVVMQCRDCHRDFIFFAEEQKHWRELLGFNDSAHAVRCAECRYDQRQKESARHRYLELCEKPQRSTEEDLEWLEEYCTLYQAGRMGEKSKHKALHILNKLEKTPVINRARWEECRHIIKP